MFGLLAGGLSALGGLTDSFSGLLGPLLGYSSARDANSNMRKMASENRDWLNRMSNTAHQREVRDLRAAGLNPILSAGGLSGASTPSVSTDYAQQSYTPDFSGVGKGLKNAASAVDFYNTQSNKEANTELQHAQAEEANSAKALNEAKTITEGHEAKIRSIDAKYRDDVNFLGTEKAASERRKAIAEADIATANALFRLSPSGHSAYVHNEWNKAFKGINPATYSFMLARQKLGGANLDSAPPDKRWYHIRDAGSQSRVWIKR